ncbi:MAG: 2-hydroxyacyl-CoA dehydratase family protein [Promethearchaeota archaeon]
MVNKIELENRAFPYKMLLEATSTMCELVDRIIPETAVPSLEIGLKCLKSVFQDCIEKAGEGLPIIGYHFALPSEYLFAFDCVPQCMEAISFMLSAMLPNTVEKYFDIINNYGHPYHTCSAQKGTMGMSLDNLTHFDAIITPTAPCDNTCASYPFFKLKKKYPLIMIDMPYKHDDDAFKYYGQEIRRGLEELGKIIDQEPDYKKLKKHIEIENKVGKTMYELFEIRKAIPCPVENMANAMSSAAQIYMAGRPEKKTFYDGILKAAKKRLRAGIHHGGIEEKIRSIWPYMLTFFDLSLCEWLDRYLGLTILFDVFNYNYSDPININKDIDTMFYGMAKKGMEFPMNRQSSQFYYTFIEDCIRFAKEFSADCFIYTSSIACKQFGSVPQILREALKDEVGIPMLVIDLDVADPRITNLETIKEKIKMFAQTLL